MELAERIDHTLLRPGATRADVVAACAEAAELGVASLCVAPVHLPLPDAGVTVGTVVGFPTGAHAQRVKAHEAEAAAAAGATELEMVIALGAAKAGDWGAVHA